jgi:hypothetical protein
MEGEIILDLKVKGKQQIYKKIFNRPTIKGDILLQIQAECSLEHWGREFESHWRHGCLCVYTVSVVLCVCSGLATG